MGSIGALNSGSLGPYDLTVKSAAIETIFDFTQTVDDETNPFVLCEFGGSGTGDAVVLNNDQLHFFAANSNSFVVSGNHNLTAGQTSVQVVAVFQFNAANAEHQ